MEILRQPEFWVLIAFLLAVAFLFWKARGRIVGGLDQRAARIKSELDEAARLRDEARRTLAEFQRKERDALTEAEQIMAQARLEAERIAKAAERDLALALERRQKQAVEKIAMAETKAVAELRAQAVDVAIAATRRMLAEDISPARKSALVDDAIADDAAPVRSFAVEIADEFHAASNPKRRAGLSTRIFCRVAASGAKR